MTRKGPCGLMIVVGILLLLAADDENIESIKDYLKTLDKE